MAGSGSGPVASTSSEPSSRSLSNMRPEREQRGQQQRHPQNARCNAREQVEIGPDPQGQQRHDDQIEAKRHAYAAALLPGQEKVAAHEFDERVHAATALLPRCSSRALAKPSGTWVAATHQPPSRQMGACGRREHLLRRQVEGDGGLVEQPDRPLGQQQAGKTEPPLLPGREVRGRDVA